MTSKKKHIIWDPALIPDFVIGDPDQAIYGFRGTDVRFFDRFLQDYPDAQKIRLTQNYRSGKSILTASLQVISRAERKEERQLTAVMDEEKKKEALEMLEEAEKHKSLPQDIIDLKKINIERKELYNNSLHSQNQINDKDEIEKFKSKKTNHCNPIKNY